MTPSPTTPSSRNPAVLFAQIAFILALGVGIGVADAFIRPVKLGRSVSEFDLPLATPNGVTPPTNAGAQQPDTPAPANAGASTTSPSTATTGAPSTDPASKFTPESELPKGHITIDKAKAAYDTIAAGGAVSFVDARDKEKFAAGHIPGAVRLALADFLEGVPVKLGLLPREHMILVYCGGGKCDESERVAEQLDGLGYSRIFIIHDGFPGWQAAGHPVETGEDIE